MTQNKNELYQTRLDTGTTHDITEDFSLPDYMPEVKRILSSYATVLPENKYIDQGEITLSGLVSYNVLYIGDDDSVVSAPLNSEYSVRLSCPNADLSGLSQESLPTYTTVNSVVCRATGPRRLTLSARMYTKAFATIAAPYTENVFSSPDDDGEKAVFNSNALERKCTDVTSGEISCQSITGSVNGNFKEREGSKVVACTAGAGISDIRRSGKNVCLRADAYINCLILTPDGEYINKRVKSPFEENVRLQAGTSSEGQDVSAVMRCASVNVSGSEDGSYSWELEYDVDLICTAEHRATLTDDIYSTEFETVSQTQKLPFVSFLKNANTRLSVSSSKQIPADPSRRVCFAQGKCVIDHAECIKDGKILASGSCVVSVLLGGSEFSHEEISIPVKLECDCPASEGARFVICDCSVMYADARLDSEKLVAEAELTARIIAYSACKKECIESCEILCEKPVPAKDNCLKIYFPAEDEDMWDIAKKYHCRRDDLSKIASENAVIIAR